MYEGDATRAADDDPGVEARMIDFAHVRAEGRLDDGYMVGLRNVIAHFARLSAGDDESA